MRDNVEAYDPNEIRQLGRFFTVDVDTYGMPFDRTICPDCLGQPDSSGCRYCGGRAVCPVCRGAEVVSFVGVQLRYRPCHGCCSNVESFERKKGTERPIPIVDRTKRDASIARERERVLLARADGLPLNTPAPETTLFPIEPVSVEPWYVTEGLPWDDE